MRTVPYALMMKSFAAVLLIMGILMTGSSTKTEPIAGERTETWAQPIMGTGVENLHRVDARLYRSGQPDAPGFQKLYDLGIRYVLNLRQFHDDQTLFGDMDFSYHRIKINTSKMTYSQLLEGVAFIMKADAPVLVHCLHGSDRTGTMVAAYRIAAHGWSKEKAIEEFRNGGYGYHNIWFQNLPKLILTIDEETFRQDVKHYDP
jgi:tyrosine-protein phosphatase SIW14